MWGGPGVIEVTGLTKSFGTLYALRGIDLSIDEGTSLSIFGPNGAGKSTFIRILSTLSNGTSGKVTIAGMDISKEPQKVRCRLGVISHSTYLYDELSAEENLRFYGTMYELDTLDERVASVLNEVGLFERREDRVRTYSRGMQQRLSIARAMLHQPDILYLDEPYTGLDQHASKMLTEWLSKLRSQKRTIVLVTHDITHGLAFADRAAIFLRGKVAYNEPVEQQNLVQFQQTYFDIIAGGRAA
ncbi:ABC transporter ATP-binding protein [candidate division KSB1 bacterium]|nr:ABC transporter ATP-binding protein [candidate division KSB1 bacterium]